MIQALSFYISQLFFFDISPFILLHLFGKYNQNDLVIQGMHSDIRSNKNVFWTSAERRKMKFHSLKRKENVIHKGIQMMCECKEDSKEFVMFFNQGFYVGDDFTNFMTWHWEFYTHTLWQWSNSGRGTFFVEESAAKF